MEDEEVIEKSLEDKLFEAEVLLKHQSDLIERLEERVKLMEEQFAKVFPRG